MRKKFKRLTAIAMSTLICMSSVFVQASELGSMNAENVSLEKDIITINNVGYNAEEFMDRVISCTNVSAPLGSMLDDNGDTITFEYNNNRQRVKKVTEDGVTTYVWDDYGNMQMEILPNGETLDYLYTVVDGLSLLTGLSYKGNTYHYVLDEGDRIIGLEDFSGQLICSYEYNEYGLPLAVYEVEGNQYIEHQDNTGDEFIGCLNSLRYNGDCFDVETNIYCEKTGSYYDPENNEVLGAACNLDMKKLFGDQYNKLKAAYDRGASRNSAGLTDDDIYYLISSAGYFYENGINNYTSAGNGSNWYTSYNTETKMYYLAARIIFAENGNKDGDINMKKYFKYNRQGVGWVILNHFLEDDYRYHYNQNHDDKKPLRFSASGTTQPSIYSVLTKDNAFTSISIYGHAKDEMKPSNVAYQEAFWIASCMYVCNTFEEYNAVVPRPDGITYQCNFRGVLDSNSFPDPKWSHVVFPGDKTDYTGANNYSAFEYFSNISKFNVFFHFKIETDLCIISEYY